MTSDKKTEKTKDKKTKDKKSEKSKTKSEKQNIEEYNSDEEEQKVKKENKVYTGWKGIDKGLMLSDLTQKKNVE